MTSPGLRSVAEDAVRVADAFGLDRFAVLGYSGGTPFAAATGVVAPERVTAVGLCAAVASWDSPAFDHVAFGGSWDVDVSAVRAPTWVWQGTLDPVTPPAHGEWWQRTVLRDAGGVTPRGR